MGEPAGIGGEIALRAWLVRRENALPPFFLLDDPVRIRALADAMDLAVPVSMVEEANAARAVFEDALPVMRTSPLAPAVVAGKPNPAHGPAILESIERAVALAVGADVGAVVTNPIHKYSLRQAGFDYPGHTEFLAALMGTATTPVMMLVGSDLRVVPVTVHLSLSGAIKALTTEVIINTATIAAAALRDDFRIATPRLAVAALNPHAGEGGLMGSEEIDVIAPAIDALRQRGLAVSGPSPADTLFHVNARAQYDAVICMYHDQALIPLKTIDFDRGVNVTLGLPIVRTSPDHGTALDIAGTARANPASLIAAIKLGAEMADRRRTASLAAAVNG